jgi:hypothetical protein
MKIKASLLFAMVLGVSSFKCETPSGLNPETNASSCSDIRWLQPYIDAFKNNTAVKSEIIRYLYNGKIVYYMDSCKGCPDSMAIVYNCMGEVICQFGGIAGFNTCPDFTDKATQKKVIWSN